MSDSEDRFSRVVARLLMRLALMMYICLFGFRLYIPVHSFQYVGANNFLGSTSTEGLAQENVMQAGIETSTSRFGV